MSKSETTFENQNKVRKVNDSTAQSTFLSSNPSWKENV